MSLAPESELLRTCRNTSMIIPWNATDSLNSRLIFLYSRTILRLYLMKFSLHPRQQHSINVNALAKKSCNKPVISSFMVYLSNYPDTLAEHSLRITRASTRPGRPMAEAGEFVLCFWGSGFRGRANRRGWVFFPIGLIKINVSLAGFSEMDPPQL